MNKSLIDELDVLRILTMNDIGLFNDVSMINFYVSLPLGFRDPVEIQPMADIQNEMEVMLYDEK